MTIFGPGVSSYEAGIDLSRLTDGSFVIAKVTEGTYYTDADLFQSGRHHPDGAPMAADVREAAA